MTEPLSGVRSPAMHSTVVVLPARLGPTIPKISPASMLSDTSATAMVSPYRFRSGLTSMIGTTFPLLVVVVRV